MHNQRVIPEPGQESVWDYPRPPRLDPRPDLHVRVIFNGVVIADTNRPIRVLETSHPPAIYIPPEDIKREHFIGVVRTTYCEFKGAASYYTVRVGDSSSEAAAWYYANPSPGFEMIRNFVSLYPGRMGACYINDELVTPQEGNFYGGWITKNIVGPFKGAPGTWGW